MTDSWDSSAEPAIAAQLRAARKDSGLSRERVASLLGVSAKSIERWETSGKVGVVQLRALRAIYADVAAGRIGLDNDAARGTTASEGTTWLPTEFHETARRFQIEMARLGANDEEVDHIDAALHSPAVAQLVNVEANGSTKPLERGRAEFELQIQMLRQWVRDHMQMRGAELRDVIEQSPESPPPRASRTDAPRSAKVAKNRRPPGKKDDEENRKRA